MSDPVVVVLSTCPSSQVAKEIADRLVSERLAACVNRLDGVKSTYLWDGSLHDHEEILLMIKTTASRFEALRERLEALHPYQLPELIALDVAGGSKAYLDWVRSHVAIKGE